MLAPKHFSYIKLPNYDTGECFVTLFFFECYCPLNHMDSVEGNRSASENQYLPHTYQSTSGHRPDPCQGSLTRGDGQRAGLQLGRGNLRAAVGAGSPVLHATKPHSRKTKVIRLRYGWVCG